MKTTFANSILKATKTVTEKAVVKSANSSSCMLAHQPKAPQTLKKFRKF